MKRHSPRKNIPMRSIRYSRKQQDSQLTSAVTNMVHLRSYWLNNQGAKGVIERKRIRGKRQIYSESQLFTDRVKFPSLINIEIVISNRWTSKFWNRIATIDLLRDVATLFSQLFSVRMIMQHPSTCSHDKVIQYCKDSIKNISEIVIGSPWFSFEDTLSTF